MDRPFVVVDNREPKDAVPRLAEYGILASSDRLSSGDYMFMPHGQCHRIERKTISNLLQSMADKQLVDQAHRLITESDRAWILREGRYDMAPSGELIYFNPRHPKANLDGWVTSGWDYGSFDGIMLDLQLLGLGFIDCLVLGDYPRTIARFVSNVSKENHSWLRDRQRPDIMTLDKQYRNAIWSLCAFDGVGPEIAAALLDRYGSLHSVVCAVSHKPIEEVSATKVGARGSRLGDKVVKRLRAELMEKWASPLSQAAATSA